MTPRPETGPMIFPDDWRGIFIRGDNALYWASVIGMILQKDHGLNFIEISALNSLRDSLTSAHQEHPEPAQRAELQP